MLHGVLTVTWASSTQLWKGLVGGCILVSIDLFVYLCYLWDADLQLTSVPGRVSLKPIKSKSEAPKKKKKRRRHTKHHEKHVEPEPEAEPEPEPEEAEEEEEAGAAEDVVEGGEEAEEAEEDSHRSRGSAAEGAPMWIRIRFHPALWIHINRSRAYSD